jgi:hypothetical protein
MKLEITVTEEKDDLIFESKIDTGSDNVTVGELVRFLFKVSGDIDGVLQNIARKGLTVSRPADPTPRQGSCQE